MHTLLTTTLFFPLNIAKLFSMAISRSPSIDWQRKLPTATISNLKRSDMTMITSTFSQASLQNTVDQRWYESSNQLPLGSSSNNFLCSKKISGEESFGVTVSIWQQLASGVIGLWSNNMSLVREKQRRNCDNLIYSPKAMPSGHTPSAMPRGD